MPALFMARASLFSRSAAVTGRKTDSAPNNSSAVGTSFFLPTSSSLPTFCLPPYFCLPSQLPLPPKLLPSSQTSVFLTPEALPVSTLEYHRCAPHRQVPAKSLRVY